MWREECVSAATHSSRLKSGGAAPPLFEEHVGSVNLHHRPLPWLILKMRRRTNVTSDKNAHHGCTIAGHDGGGCFGSENDKRSWTGAETGFVYTYSESMEGFPFFVRLGDTAPEKWLG